MLDLPRGVFRRVLLFGLSAFFVVAGVNHFRTPDFYVSIVPPYLPAPLALVYLSGVFEILGGFGVLLARTRRLAGFGLMALLIAVYPANVHMALHPEQFAEVASPGLLYARLPLQIVFVVWAWAATRPQRDLSYQATSQ